MLTTGRILRVLARKLRLDGDFDFEQLAKMTPGYVGADLSALTAAAGVCAMKRIFKDMKDFVAAGQSLLPIPEEPAKEAEPDTDNAMEIDETPTTTTIPPIAASVLAAEPTPETSLTIPSQTTSTTNLDTLHAFITAFSTPLTPAQLEPLSITLDDFLTAIPKVQPSSKREGFATVPDVTWADIGALSDVRLEMQMSITERIRRPNLFASVGITAPAGVLLWGPPGCGKTLMAKAVANESKANFISVRGPELLNKYVGESERAVRQVFVRARASTPCIIFFDELDALVPRRDDALSDASARIVNMLLTELDGLNDRKGVYVVAATNRPDIIDPAMLRPGRLDKAVLVDLPSPDERVEILKTLTKKMPLSPEVDVSAIGRSERCHGFSGADLAALVKEAGVLSLEMELELELRGEAVIKDEREGEGRHVLRMEHFERAFEFVAPSVGEKEMETYRRLAERFGGRRVRRAAAVGAQ